MNENDAPAATPDLAPERGDGAPPSTLPLDLDVVIAASEPADRLLLRRLLGGCLPAGSIREAATVADAASMARRNPPGCLILSDRFADGGADEVLLRLTVARGMVSCPVVVIAAS